MYLGEHARSMPDKPALIEAGSGAVTTFRELDARSNRLAHYFYRLGLRRGGHVAVMMENRRELLEVGWAAMRSGLYVTAVNRYLTADEAGYIVDDCDATVTLCSAALSETALRLPALAPRCTTWIMADAAPAGWLAYEDVLAGSPPEPLAEEWLGDTMLYSSGTTGRPKGVVRPLQDAKVYEAYRAADTIQEYRFGTDTIYLCPAPLYHAAPLSFTMAAQHAGGTVVVMPRFDATEALALIERHRITHSQWVPTMFVRMLKLAPERRQAFDLSSHVCAIHAAAPCPPEVKRAMIDWWGPTLFEYYAATESNGVTRIDSNEWLQRPGSVGRARTGILHICDDDGRELPPGETGLIYFERDSMPFAYHKDPAKTAAARHPIHPNWSTLGDIGHADADRYLYLTDRKAFMIISGGVNIYPREIEDALVGHPAVRDVAVFGVPSAEMGEDVKAVVELMDGVSPSPAMAGDLLAYLDGRVARYMIPRTLDFMDELPRLPTGKLYKKALRDRYWTTEIHP